MNKKVITLIVAVLAIIGLVLALMAMVVDPDDMQAASDAASPLVSYSLVLLGITAVVAVVGSLFALLKNPAALKKALLGLAVLGLVLLVSYLSANSDQVIDAKNEVIAATGSSVSKLTSTGIIFSVILMLVAGVFFVVDLLKGIVKS
ncbi:MAG: hypothetical protein ACPGU6_01155 [Tenacibaculum sp.]